MQRCQLTRSWPAMGSTARVTVVAATRKLTRSLTAQAACRIGELERRWSRFIPSSEVSRLNDRPGMPTRVSSDTYRLVAAGLDGLRRTGGRFNPTMLEPIVAAGYDRNFNSLRSGIAVASASVGAPPGATLHLDPMTSAVHLGVHSGFDPGGVGKGLAADIVADELMDADALGACVELGGDLRARGDGPEGSGWVVAIEDPRRRRPLRETLWIADGGVASSSVIKRSWQTTAGPSHHIIDPETGRPAKTAVIGACIVASTCALAEVFATAACAGMPPQEIGQAGVSGVLFYDDDQRLSIGDFRNLTA